MAESTSFVVVIALSAIFEVEIKPKRALLSVPVAMFEAFRLVNPVPLAFNEPLTEGFVIQVELQIVKCGGLIVFIGQFTLVSEGGGLGGRRKHGQQKDEQRKRKLTN
jgi:hypothetical protein